MSETFDQEFVKISGEETSLRSALAELDARRIYLADRRRKARQEKAKYELARWLGPVMTQVDVWPIYAIYILAIVGPSALVMFGLAKAIWFPTWLAAMVSLITAIVILYYGWRLRDVEADIRQRFREDYQNAIQRLELEITDLASEWKLLGSQQETTQAKLTKLLVRKQQVENEISVQQEKERQENEQIREQDERDKKQEKLRWLNSRWETLRGIPFEEFLANVLRLHGHEVETTPASNDQGVDLVAVIHGQRFAIQAKGYANTVGNEAVQQVIAGMNLYNCDHAAVITNSSFTNSALILAESNDCLMIDNTRIPALIINGWPEEGVKR